MSIFRRKQREFFYDDDANPEEYDEYDEEAEDEDEDEEENADEEVTAPRSATARRQTYAAASKADTANTRLVYSNGEPRSYIDIYTPEGREDATEIADALMRGHSVTINLESVNHELAIRILDFLSGVVFACGGEIVKIAKNTWMVTPEGVGIKKQGFLTETDSNDAFYG